MERLYPKDLWQVAPFVGAWIEIPNRNNQKRRKEVAPFVGAWIEIGLPAASEAIAGKSLPSWERGLKFAHQIQQLALFLGRSLRGSVD